MTRAAGTSENGKARKDRQRRMIPLYGYRIHASCWVGSESAAKVPKLRILQIPDNAEAFPERGSAFRGCCPTGRLGRSACRHAFCQRRHSGRTDVPRDGAEAGGEPCIRSKSCPRAAAEQMTPVLRPLRDYSAIFVFCSPTNSKWGRLLDGSRIEFNSGANARDRHNTNFIFRSRDGIRRTGH